MNTDHLRCVNEGGHSASQRHPRSECPEERPSQYDDRIRRAYLTAMRANHEGGRVELHLGQDVIDHLRSLGPTISTVVGAPRAWGFPVVPRESDPQHISVHTVQNIL